MHLASLCAAVDTLKQFLEDHKRANLPIIVANFIHSVKVWQRWWRNFEQTTNNRLKVLLVLWDEVKAEWFENEELKLHNEAENKKQVSERANHPLPTKLTS